VPAEPGEVGRRSLAQLAKAIAGGTHDEVANPTRAGPLSRSG